MKTLVNSKDHLLLIKCYLQEEIIVVLWTHFAFTISKLFCERYNFLCEKIDFFSNFLFLCHQLMDTGVQHVTFIFKNQQLQNKEEFEIRTDRMKTSLV